MENVKQITLLSLPLNDVTRRSDYLKGLASFWCLRKLTLSSLTWFGLRDREERHLQHPATTQKNSALHGALRRCYATRTLVAPPCSLLGCQPLIVGEVTEAAVRPYEDTLLLCVGDPCAPSRVSNRGLYLTRRVGACSVCLSQAEG